MAFSAVLMLLIKTNPFGDGPFPFIHQGKRKAHARDPGTPEVWMIWIRGNICRVSPDPQWRQEVIICGESTYPVPDATWLLNLFPGRKILPPTTKTLRSQTGNGGLSGSEAPGG